LHEAESVATTLALADQHNCIELKDACIEFMIFSKKKEWMMCLQVKVMSTLKGHALPSFLTYGREQLKLAKLSMLTVDNFSVRVVT
jgi:hypothetical protein